LRAQISAVRPASIVGAEIRERVQAERHQQRAVMQAGGAEDQAEHEDEGDVERVVLRMECTPTARRSPPPRRPGRSALRRARQQEDRENERSSNREPLRRERHPQ
jgi:hypothetical protein